MKTHNSHKKQDVYSLGLMILRVLANLGKRSTTLEPGGRTGPLATNFYRLMRGMLYPTPEKRFTIDDSIVFLRKIINEAETYNRNHPNDTKTYGQIPFKANQDPQYMKDIFAQGFGNNNNKLEKLLKYINTLL